MPFPGLQSTALIIIGTGLWASASILHTLDVHIARTVATTIGSSQGRVQDVVKTGYGIAMTGSTLLYFVAAAILIRALLTDIELRSFYNYATVGVTVGTGFWAIGSGLAAQQNQLATWIAGRSVVGGPQGYRQSQIGTAIAIIVSIGLVCFVAAILLVGIAAYRG